MTAMVRSSTALGSSSLKRAQETIQTDAPISLSCFHHARSSFQTALLNARRKSAEHCALSRNLGITAMRFALALDKIQPGSPQFKLQLLEEAVQSMSVALDHARDIRLQQNVVWELHRPVDEWIRSLEEEEGKAVDECLGMIRQLHENRAERLTRLRRFANQFPTASKAAELWIEIADAHYFAGSVLIDQEDVKLGEQELHLSQQAAQRSLEKYPSPELRDERIVVVLEMCRKKLRHLQRWRLLESAKSMLAQAALGNEVLWDAIDNLSHAARLSAEADDKRREAEANCSMGYIYFRFLASFKRANRSLKKGIMLANDLQPSASEESWAVDAYRSFGEVEQKIVELQAQEEQEERGQYLAAIASDVELIHSKKAELPLGSFLAFVLQRYPPAKPLRRPINCTNGSGTPSPCTTLTRTTWGTPKSRGRSGFSSRPSARSWSTSGTRATRAARCAPATVTGCTTRLTPPTRAQRATPRMRRVVRACEQQHGGQPLGIGGGGLGLWVEVGRPASQHYLETLNRE